MPKKDIPIELKGILETYYKEALATGKDNRKILSDINKLLEEAGIGGYTSEKSLYNLVNQFDSVKNQNINKSINTSLDVNKSISKNISKEISSKLKDIGKFDMDLSWQNEMTKDIASRMYKRFITIDEKGDKANTRDLIEIARVTKEFIDLGVKIDALNSKKIDVNNPNTPQMGIFIGIPGQTSKRLEEVTASVVETTQLSEASYG
jgi:hypothetical protein